MYEVFDKFIAVDTWSTRHPHDERCFYDALNKVVWLDEFNADQMVQHLRSKRNIPSDDHDSHLSNVIDEYGRDALAVWNFVKYNRLSKPNQKPLGDESSFFPSSFSPPGFYALEKLGEAIDALVEGAGRVQERLGEAMTYLIRVRPDEMPDDDLRRMLIGIKDDLTFEGQLPITLQNLNDFDASAIARRISELHDRLRKFLNC
jgi:hypothetical protein